MSSDDIVKQIEGGGEILSLPHACSTGPIDIVARIMDPNNVFHMPRAAAASSPIDTPRAHAAINDSRDHDDAEEPARRKASPGGDDLDLKCALFERTDFGNVYRVKSRFGEDIFYCPALGWIWWDGQRWWQYDAEYAVQRLCAKAMEALEDEACALAKSDLDVEIDPKKGIWLSDLVRKWGLASRSAAKMAAVKALLPKDFTKAHDQLDADPAKINAPNGTLHATKRDEGDYIELRPHDRADLITRMCGAAHDPNATCPKFRSFLDRILPPGVDGSRRVQEFLARWFGYSLTGFTGEQKMVVFYGRGRNGKGVLVNVMMHLAGDYAASIAIESLLDVGFSRAGSAATPDLAKIPTIRMLCTSEPKQGAVLDEALIKRITGGDPITARHLNRDFFDFTPVLKLLMQTNYRPKVKGTDEGIWSRIMLVPFNVFIPPEERDPDLLQKLKGEAPGIFNWMLDGLRDWMDRGLAPPPEVQEATKNFRDTSDPVGRFLFECVQTLIGERVSSKDLLTLYNRWAAFESERPKNAQEFSRALDARGFRKIKSSGIMFWDDVKLIKTIAEFPDSAGDDAHAEERHGDAYP
jgi:putative DNA primase/helicase